MKYKQYKRPIAVKLFDRNKKVIWTRYYTNMVKAVSRGVELSMTDGEPGHVLEFSSSNFGYLIASLKLRIGTHAFNSMQIEFAVSDGFKHKPVK